MLSAMQAKRTTGGYIQIIYLAIVVIIVAATVSVVLIRHHDPTKQPADLSRYCVGRTFARGDSGGCVRDVQTLVQYVYANFDELPTCKSYIDGAVAYSLKTTGTYNYADESVVQILQSWAQCYAHQEGFSTNVKMTGSVNMATWGELCTYGYTDPSHNGVSGAAASIAAGKDAGCAKLSA